MSDRRDIAFWQRTTSITEILRLVSISTTLLGAGSCVRPYFADSAFIIPAGSDYRARWIASSVWAQWTDGNSCEHHSGKRHYTSGPEKIFLAQCDPLRELVVQLTVFLSSAASSPRTQLPTQHTIRSRHRSTSDSATACSSRSLTRLSKSFDQASSFEGILNPVDPRLSRSLSAFDARHRIVFSYYWELPFRNSAASKAK